MTGTVTTVTLPRLLAVLAALHPRRAPTRRGREWPRSDVARLVETIIRGRPVAHLNLGRSNSAVRGMAFWLRERGAIWMPGRAP